MQAKDGPLGRRGGGLSEELGYGGDTESRVSPRSCTTNKDFHLGQLFTLKYSGMGKLAPVEEEMAAYPTLL